ncbi:MAG: DNA cytosine methyltransferase [Actinomycetia bacterium]|nr:DNA cytosine methyltransferase [Actinomycetes bacterium]MCH9762099.1 DNA cytosine methyltransferase [Actinomycetes bacterium]
MSALTAVDLFAGAGGASLGIVRAGYELRLAIELDRPAATTHAAHIQGHVVQTDIRALTGKKMRGLAGVETGELDLLFAGPPCQGFSMIGPRQISDLRNTLFHEVVRATNTLRPKAVVIENVPGLATLARGQYLGKVLERLRSAGYHAACAELLAAQYGTPQMRWRLVVIGWRQDLHIPPGFGFPAPTHGRCEIGDLISNVTIPQSAYKGFLTTRDAIGDLPEIAAGGTGHHYAGRPRGVYQELARTTMDGYSMPPHELHDHYAASLNSANLERLRHIGPGQDWRDLPDSMLPPSMRRALRKDHTRRYRRMTWNGVPRAIITRFRDPKSGEYTHPTQHRTISIREAARIQGFPDWFEFTGSKTSKYTQVGNAVPVPLAQAIANEVAACIRGEPHRPRVDNPFRRRPVPFLGPYGELIETSAA